MENLPPARKDSPQDWAATQNRLGDVLMDRARASEGEDQVRLCDEAAQACRAALQVYTREDFPRQWAEAQLHLGKVLIEQALILGGQMDSYLHDEAVHACRAALQVYIREDFPQQWAESQINLGKALINQSGVSAEEHLRLCGEAVQASRAALQVHTRENFPKQWAETQIAVAKALEWQALACELEEDVVCDYEERARLFGEAVKTWRTILEVFTRRDYPLLWAETQNNLAEALCDQAFAIKGGDYWRQCDESAQACREAVQACRSALEVFTRKDFPVDWAETHNNLARALRDQAEASDVQKRIPLLKEAIACYEASLEVYTKEHFRDDHRITRDNLWDTRNMLAEAENKTTPCADK